MSYLIYTFALALFAAGLFFCFGELLGTPDFGTVRAMRAVRYRKARNDTDRFARMIDRLAIVLSSGISYPKSVTEKLRRTLESANDPTPPALYISRCVVKSALMFLTAALASIFVKPLFIAALAMPVLVIVSEMQKADKLTESYRRRVEQDLPDFVATISTELTASRDVVRMMRSYLPTSGTELRKELLITIADMQSGTYEIALSRLATRVNSPTLNDVVRGLVGVVRGNDEAAYFRMLSYDLKQMEINEMKKNAQKCIPRLSAATMILLASIMLLFVGVLLADMMTGANTIF